MQISTTHTPFNQNVHQPSFLWSRPSPSTSPTVLLYPSAIMANDQPQSDWEKHLDEFLRTYTPSPVPHVSRRNRGDDIVGIHPSITDADIYNEFAVQHGVSPITPRSARNFTLSPSLEARLYYSAPVAGGTSASGLVVVMVDSLRQAKRCSSVSSSSHLALCGRHRSVRVPTITTLTIPACLPTSV